MVEGARLENDSGDAHRVIPKHFFAQAILRIPAANASRSEPVNAVFVGGFEATLHSSYTVLDDQLPRRLPARTDTYLLTLRAAMR